MLSDFEKYLWKLKKKNGDRLLSKTIEEYLYYVEQYENRLQGKESEELVSEMNKILKQRNNIVIFSAFKNYLAFTGTPKDCDLARTLLIPEKSANSMNSDRFLQKKILSKQELKKLFDEADDELKLILSFMMDTGVRRSELLGIEFKNIEFVDKRKDKSNIYAKINIIEGKGGKNRSVFIGKITYDLLMQQRKEQNPDDKVFVFYDKSGEPVVKQDDKLYRTIKKHSMNVLGREVSPHDMRRNFATNLANNGADVLGISKSLGHTTLGMSMRYIGASDNLSRKAFEKYSGGILDE